MRILCPKCGKKGNADNSIVGKRIRCPFCKEIFVAEKVEEDVPIFTPDQPPEHEKKDSPNYVLVGSAFVVLIGMFLPWIDLGIVSLNAFSLTQIVKIAATVKADEISSLFAVTFTFYYLVPAVVGAIISLEFTAIKRRANAVTLLAYLLLLICTQFLFFLVIGGTHGRTQGNVWNNVGIGYWLTIAAILTIVIGDMVESGFGWATITGILTYFSYYNLILAMTFLP